MEHIPQRRLRLNELIERKETFDVILDHVANGGSLLGLCKVWDVRYSDAVRWIYADGERKRLYEESLTHQSEWMIARLLDELRALSTVDIRKAFDEQGRLKEMKDMPEEVAQAIASVEVFEEYEWNKESKSKVQTGWTKRVKFYDKLRAIELLGKKLAMFVDRIEHRFTLEQLVSSSMQPVAPRQMPDSTAAPAIVIQPSTSTTDITTTKDAPLDNGTPQDGNIPPDAGTPPDGGMPPDGGIPL